MRIIHLIIEELSKTPFSLRRKIGEIGCCSYECHYCTEHRYWEHCKEMSERYSNPHSDCSSDESWT